MLAMLAIIPLYPMIFAVASTHSIVTIVLDICTSVAFSTRSMPETDAP